MIWSDAWVLLATIYASRTGEEPASLADVIALADYINHAILTYEEVEGGLARLVPRGYLNYIDGQLCPSQKTVSFYSTMTRPRRTALEEMKDLEAYLGASPWFPGQNPQSANEGVSFPKLAQAQFDEAIQEYLSRHPRLTGVSKKKDKKRPNHGVQGTPAAAGAPDA